MNLEFKNQPIDTTIETSTPSVSPRKILREKKETRKFDFAKLQTAVRALGITSSKQYSEEQRNKKKNNGWPATDTLRNTPKWKKWVAEGKNPWDEFLGREAKKEYTFSELQTAVRALGITSSEQYTKKRKEHGWPATDTLKKNPEWKKWEEEGKNPWDEFLGREAKKEYTFSELQTAVRALGITSSGQYEEKRKEHGWPATDTLKKNPEWKKWEEEGKNPWDEFLGREAFDFVKLQTAVRALGITSSKRYDEKQKEHGWPTIKTLYSTPEWKKWKEEGKNPWDEFLGREAKKEYTFSELQTAVRALGITSSEQYTKKRKEHGWPALATLYNTPEWKKWVAEGKNPWDEFLGRKTKKEYTFLELQTAVRALGITSSEQYRKKQKEHGWPVSKTLYKAPEWKKWEEEGKNPWDEFLGREPSDKNLYSKALSFIAGLEKDSLGARDFKKLLSLFGASSVVDLLYAYNPEFKRLPVTYLRSELAKYLGDYMIVRSGNVLQDVELALPYLGEKSFQDSLFTVIKEDAIHYYQTEKKKHKEKEDTRILDEYITLLRDKAILFHNEDFTSVVSRVEAYLFSLTNDFHKPESIVDEVSQGRTFPDLNQTINIKEVRDGKRVLIGDEMGMGKSASAILSKEYLGVGTALVVVPSNVISTWHRYLSDVIGPDGKQLGYFKKGCAPKVLELESAEDIELITSGEYDYVLISHEKFKEEYAERLKNQPIEMVIIDEVHKFKNVTDGKRSQALLDLMQEFKDREAYTVLLSGTPVPNKIKDLVITLKLLYPEEFGSMDTNILVSSIIKGDNINLRDLLFKKTQMKKLTESVEMPEKTEQDSFVTLSEKERELYELLLEDDELTATEKLQTLRQFCLNPRKIFPDVEIESSKVQEARDAILSHFETKNKMVFFVNGYIDGIIRGENSIIEQLQLPKDITVKIIDGDVSKDERTEIERDIKYMTQGKILLVLSGMAADVGVDFSSAEGVYFYNEPWTKFDKMQQQARVYRPGLTHDITVDTSLVEGSIEEGIHYYLEMKYKAIMKLLEGVPLSEIEQSMLLFDEKVEGIKTIDGDQWLAEEWLQSPVNRLNRFFGATKEIGEDKFMGFLEKYGEEYAEYYTDMGTRGFQANTARLVTTLIKRYREEKGLHGEITILDVASGPEMLAKKVPENEKDNVFSLDINHAHFKEGTGRQVVAGFTAIPIRNGSVDYLNMSLAIHYSKFRPSKKEFERLEVFGEIARVLKVGGRATINLVYSLEWKNKKELGELLEKLGLKIVEACTGTATSGSNFASECLTFEKREDVNLKEKLQQLQDGDYELLKGLKLSTQSTRKLKKSQEVTNRFSLNGKIFEANLNQEDVRLLVEQEHIQEEGKLLIQEYGDTGSIPKRELLKRSILRYVSGSKYKLVKKSSYTKTFIHMN